MPDETWEQAARVIAMLGMKWSLRVLSALSRGPRRYNELVRAIPGIHPAVLASTLRRMQRDGLIDRTVADGPPAEVSYQLTELACAAFPLVAELARWRELHATELSQRPP